MDENKEQPQPVSEEWPPDKLSRKLVEYAKQERDGMDDKELLEALIFAVGWHVADDVYPLEYYTLDNYTGQLSFIVEGVKAVCERSPQWERPGRRRG